MDSQKRIAVITGASRGIGLAISEAFASKGFDLILCSRNSDLLEHAVKTITHQFPVSVRSFAADLSEKQACLDFVTFVHSQGAPIDVLVNNAGVFLPGTLMQEPDDQMDFQMRTNYFSAYYITKGLWPSLKTNNRSHVFNMCSIASIMAYEAGGGYAVTKHALLGFSRSLRKEGMPKGIRVSAVMPGATLTDSWAGVELPESRFMKATDVAQTLWHAWSINEHTVMEEILIRPIDGDI
jgi:short-subunit dehydrogenase